MKVTKEQQERRQRAANYRKEAIRKIYEAAPSICRGASFLTELLGGSKFDRREVGFTRTALQSLVKEGFLEKTQIRFDGKLGNQYRLAPVKEYVPTEQDHMYEVWENSGFSPDYDPILEDAWYGCESY